MWLTCGSDAGYGWYTYYEAVHYHSREKNLSCEMMFKGESFGKLHENSLFLAFLAMMWAAHYWRYYQTGAVHYFCCQTGVVHYWQRRQQSAVHYCQCGQTGAAHYWHSAGCHGSRSALREGQACHYRFSTSRLSSPSGCHSLRPLSRCWLLQTIAIWSMWSWRLILLLEVYLYGYMHIFEFKL